MKKQFLTLGACTLFSSLLFASGGDFNSIEKIATYETRIKGGSEIVAFDKESKKMFTTNGKKNRVDMLSINHDNSANSTKIEKISSINLADYGDGINSVAVFGDLVAVAVERVSITDSSKQRRGQIVLFDTNGNYLRSIKVGYLPDMVTFSTNGSLIIVANEGQPNKDYSYDPKGSIGIIDIGDNYSYTDLTFNGVHIPAGVILKDGVDAFFDLEPEYITVQGDRAYVTLQENNAIAIVDLSNKKIVSVVPLGFKNHSKPQNSIDIEEEGKILIKTYKNLYGMYQPDTIASYRAGHKTYLVTANEGDGREYGDYENETKIKKLDLSDELIAVYKDENDLKVNNELGKNSDGKYEKLYTFGARSFSIWNEDVVLVFDSKNELAKLTAKLEPKLFNHNKGKMDGRSGNKGVEPEALAIGKVDGETYAFVGLERQSAIVIYNISNPKNAKFVKYLNTKEKDISPEGMEFVKKEDSPTGNALLLVAFEISGSTSVYEIK